MGTRSLWQSTSQTGAHGPTHTGRGSARRVQEFRISSDIFGSLNRGEAMIYTPIEPIRASILPVHLPQAEPERIDRAGPRTRCEIPVYPEQTLPTTPSSDGIPVVGPARAM